MLALDSADWEGIVPLAPILLGVVPGCGRMSLAVGGTRTRGCTHKRKTEYHVDKCEEA